MGTFEQECDRLSWMINPTEAEKREWQRTEGVILDEQANKLIEIFQERDDLRLTKAGNPPPNAVSLGLLSNDGSQTHIATINLRMQGDNVFLWLKTDPSSRFFTHGTKHPVFSPSASVDELKGILAQVLADIQDGGPD